MYSKKNPHYEILFREIFGPFFFKELLVRFPAQKVGRTDLE